MHEINARVMQRLFRNRKIVQCHLCLLLQIIQILLNIVPNAQELLLCIRILLGIWIQSLSGKLLLNMTLLDSAVDFFDSFVFLVCQLSQRQIEATEHLQVLLVRIQQQIRVLSLLLAQMVGQSGETRVDKLCDQCDAMNSGIAVADCQIQKLCMIVHHLTELFILHPPMFVLVLVQHTSFEFVVALCFEPFQLMFKLLNLCPSHLLLCSILR
mmetsp:Transcript_6304/g.11786  ORF Transcript_6304/g.11786 Transcript_6304/m.11786 type:complete len:212 (-) Transcript_6304:1409-2044(-)